MSGCGCCGPVSRKIIYKCTDKNCGATKEFEKEPANKPVCCDKPMKKLS